MKPDSEIELLDPAQCHFCRRWQLKKHIKSIHTPSWDNKLYGYKVCTECFPVLKKGGVVPNTPTQKENDGKH